jgi:hypothetical protein
MKPTIEDIKVNVDELNKITSLPNTRNKTWKLRQLIGGLCIRCQDIPSKKVSYDIGDAKLVEFYCDNCFLCRKEGRGKKDIDKLS